MKTSLSGMLALAVALMAAGIDYSALAQEVKEAHEDPEVQRVLGEHLDVAREIERLQDQVISWEASAQALRQQAPEALRRRNLAKAMLATGDVGMQQLAAVILKEPEAATLLARANELESAAKDGLVALAQGYRGIRQIISEKKKIAPTKAAQ